MDLWWFYFGVAFIDCRCVVCVRVFLFWFYFVLLRVICCLCRYLCSKKSGKTRLNEHENIAWIAKKDFANYVFVEGDGNVLSLL